jgi:hypothetical protein
VSWDKKVSVRKWKAQLYVQGVQKLLGYFDDEEAAAWAYDKAAIEHGLLDRLNFEYDPEAEALAECAQSLEFGEPGELVGCQVKCLVHPYGWCPGVLSEYITKGKFKDHYKVRLRSMYVSLEYRINLCVLFHDTQSFCPISLYQILSTMHMAG